MQQTLRTLIWLDHELIAIIQSVKWQRNAIHSSLAKRKEKSSNPADSPIRDDFSTVIDYRLLLIVIAPIANNCSRGLTHKSKIMKLK